MKTTRQLYCQYLLSSQINYTCTNLAEHFENLDHRSVYRYLKNEQLTPRLLWEKVKDRIIYSPNGAIIFDDTAPDKSYSFAIEGVRLIIFCRYLHICLSVGLFVKLSV